MKILGIGNALVDVLAQLNGEQLLTKYKLPKGSMTHVDEETSNNILNDIQKDNHQIVAGGSAANTINGLSKLGIQTGFIGKTGNDKLGNYFKTDMRNNGIEPELLISKTSTGNCKVLITPDGERTMCTFLGAAIELDANDLNIEQFKGYDCLHIEGYLVQNHALMRRAIELAKRSGMTISLDMASFNVVENNKNFLDELLHKYVNIVFANQDEASAFTNKAPEAALNDFAKICDIAVVKIGANGSLVQQGNKICKIEAIDATRVDATGAGDLYASGFLYGLSQKYSLEKCGEIGSLCSGKIVEIIGTKMSDSKWNEIKSNPIMHA